MQNAATKKNWFNYPVFEEGTKYLQIYKQNIALEQAPEVTDIIWENLDTPTKYTNRLKIIVGSILILMLVGLLALYITLRQQSIGATKNFPPLRDCTNYT